MRIWFDADNGPHVLIMNPLARELGARGHEVVFTARDRTNTCELLDLYGHEYLKVGDEYGKGLSAKVAGTLGRAWSLTRTMRGRGIDVSFGHGSRALPFASRVLGIPTLTMYDYEWVNPRMFNWMCRAILMPDVIDGGRCREAGIDPDRLMGYPGFKEHLYLAERPLDPDAVADDLGLALDRIRILLRPPATSAHYHNPEAEGLLDGILSRIAGRDDIDLIYLIRSPDQMTFLEGHDIANIVVPDKVYDGPSMVAAMDLMISGGGTMTREAAILGVPSYSFFRGRTGRVDEALESGGSLIMLRNADDVVDKLTIAKRTGDVTVPDSSELVGFVADALERAGA